MEVVFLKDRDDTLCSGGFTVILSPSESGHCER